MVSGDNYRYDRLLRTSSKIEVDFFMRFNECFKNLLIVEKQTIPHFKPLIMDSKILEGEGRGIIRDLPRPQFVKK